MINLDDYSTDSADLFAFWAKHQNGRRSRELFPDRPKGSRRATADLANYAANKGTAMGCRLRGSILAAQYYESICERIYKTLPDFARW